MLANVQNSFNGRLGGKFAVNRSITIPPHIQHIATPPGEIFIRKSCHDQKLSETNCMQHLASIFVKMCKFF